MKYTLAFSALLAAALLGASDHDYEISAMAGYTLPDDGQYLDDYGTYGAQMQYNGFESVLKPEVSFSYSKADYKYDSGNTKVFRSALNGVYEFEKGNVVTPFFKIGAGYESMSNGTFGNDSGVFADAGVGLKFDLAEDVAFKLEAIKMLKFNDSNFNNNLLLMGGFTFAFGENRQKAIVAVSIPSATGKKSASSTAIDSDKDGVLDQNDQCKNTPFGTKIDKNGCPLKEVSATLDSDKDGVFDQNDQCQNTLSGTKIDKNGCPLKEGAATLDSDKDGIFDQNDQCQKTPSGFKVDENGCPLKATINDHFLFNSDHIDSTATSEIMAFVIFMKENPLYKATITGHTDSIGTPENNQILSERRAERVKEALVAQGIESDRLIIMGKGESMPVMSNMLEVGRAENRRIELELHE